MAVSKIWSVNEWGRLREIIVGCPRNAYVPDLSDISMRSFDRPDDEILKLQVESKMPSIVIEETLEDIEGLCKVFGEAGVKVHKAITRDYTGQLVTPDWTVMQESGINIRDLTSIHGNLIVDCPSPTRSRYFESFPVRPYFQEYLKRDADAWFVGVPRPELTDANYNFDVEFGLNEVEPLFDAANCARMGKDVVIDINNTANFLGAQWIQRALDQHYGGRKVTVHTVDHLSPDHIDVIMIPLCEGVVLINPEYCSKDKLPAAFKNWKVLTSPAMNPQDYKIGSPKASNWIGLNVLVLNGEDRTVLVEKRQTGLIKYLEERKFKVIPVSWRRGRDWGGALHCVTLDLHRDGAI